jgi:hypothetical protein
MTMARRRLLSACAVAALITTALPTRPSLADEAPPPSAAGRDLAQAEDLFVREADCERALPLFERSYRAEPSWPAMSGMAVCQDLLGRPDRAHRLYALLLVEFASELPEPRRARVQARLDQLETTLGTLDLSAVPPGASIRIDGRAVAELPVSLLVGTHVVEVVAPGGSRQEQPVRIAAGRVTRLAVRLPAARPPSPRDRPWIWRSIAASGVLVAAGGAGLLGLAGRDFDAFDRSVASGGVHHAERPSSGDPALRERGERRRLAGQVLVGVGATAVVGALVVRFWPRSSSRGPVPAVGTHERGVSLGVSWSY